MKLGYHLDPTITLLDGTGRKLAYADDPGIDDRSDEYQLDPDLSYKFETDGNYLLAIRDGMYRGGEQLVYRLTIERKEPDFIVELREPVKTFYEGQEGTIQVRVRRRTNWNAPVEVWAEGLPDGVTAEKGVADPKNSVVKDTCGVNREVDGTIVVLPVRVNSTHPTRTAFRIKGRGVMNGKTVEHTAMVRYEHGSAGFIYGPMEVQTAEMTVVEPRNVLLSVPDTVTATSGKETRLKVGVRRFGEAKTGPLRLRVTGKGLDSIEHELPDGSKEATIRLSALPAEGSPLMIEALSSTGKVLGESSPVLVVIKKEGTMEGVGSKDKRL